MENHVTSLVNTITDIAYHYSVLRWEAAHMINHCSKNMPESSLSTHIRELNRKGYFFAILHSATIERRVELQIRLISVSIWIQYVTLKMKL